MKKLAPQTLAEFKGFFSACNRDALMEACDASEDDRIRCFSVLRKDPKHRMVTDVTLAQKSLVSLKLISECYLDYRRSQGYIELAERLPQAMADIAEDSLSKRMPCPKCSGQGEVRTGDGEFDVLVCENCWGSGVLVKSGDADARKSMLEAAKITGQKSPLIAQQFNMDGTFSVEGMISSGEKLIGGK